jgi:UDPglucose 6-dehydrogenase
MSLENAELTKVSINAYVTTKITFANMLADICENIPGGDVDVVAGALGMDSRIGRKYLKGALGFGGPCFPRDNVALSFVAKTLGIHTPISEITDRLNRAIPERMVERLRSYAKPGRTVAILGLAYKPHSHVVEESQSIAIANDISKAGARVVAYDPLANETARSEMFGKIVILDSAKECLQQADVVLIATPDPEFAALSEQDFPRREGMVVIDCWRLLDKKLAARSDLAYIPVGRSTDDEGNGGRLRELWSKL